MRSLPAAGAHRALLMSLIVATTAACGGEAAAPVRDTSDDLQIERVQEGDRTVVRNLAGSEWSGPARLVEDLSIGVMEGEPAYMLARPVGVAAVDDEILVLDSQDHEVKVYGMDGQFRRAFGEQGEGPGELNNPFTLFVTDDRRVLVSNGFGASKVTVYDLEGNHLDDYRVGDRPVFRFFETPDGLFANKWIVPDNPEDLNPNNRPEAYQAFGPEGYEGEVFMIPDTGAEQITMDIEIQGRTFPMQIPGTPQPVVWELTPAGELVWGWPGEYRFNVRRPDGTEFTVDRYWEPVPYDPDELDYQRRALVAQFRRNLPDFSWDGAGMPTTKPAYGGITADDFGRLWVFRLGSGERQAECMDPDEWDPAEGGNPWQEPCWRPEFIHDVFRVDGTYLGRVDSEGRVGVQHVGDGFVLSITEDEMGTPQIKRYRIVLPDATS